MRSFLVYFLLLISNIAFSQEDLYEVPLFEKIDSSELIFTGAVISTHSYIDSTNQAIFTKNTVELYSIFKGDKSLDTIIILTQGGTVGNQITITSSLLSLTPTDLGLFMCYKVNGTNLYKVYASKQGFFKFTRDQSMALCPFYNISTGDLIQQVKTHVNEKPFERKPIPSYNGQAKTIGGSLSFYPSIVTAGTGQVLTITGSGFGTSGPSSTDYVAFSDANNGGSPNFIQPNISNYISWSDSLIEVFVPSRAGTGSILVETGTFTQESSATLIVPFAIRNTAGANPSEAVLVNENGSGGSTWTMGLSFSGNSIESAFSRALETWMCATGVNWEIAPNSTIIGSPANDGVNIVAPMTLPAGVLGQCHTHLSSCNGANPYVVGQDLVFSPTANWNFSINAPSASQVDFESVALHELGHALQIAHIIETNDPLHFSIFPGDMRRTLSPVNILAGNYVMDKSTYLNPCPSIAHLQNFPSLCSIPVATDARILEVETILDDSTCIGGQDVLLYFGNYGPDTLYSTDINWSINGIQQPSLSWTGSLGLNEIVSNFNLGTYNFQDSTYQIGIWLSSQNGVQEINSEGDTLFYSFHPVNCSPDDASLAFFNQFDSLSCYSNEVLQCAIVNTGENPLTSCWVYFDDGQGTTDSLFWSGNLSTGDTSVSLNLVNYSQFLESNTFTIWTKLPNGVQDTYTSNDTLVYSFELLKMSGTYTIGGMNPDFIHPSDAINRLNNYGVCGNVILNIRPGIYIGAYAILDIPMDSSANYSLTIQSETLDSSDVILRSPPNSQVITFWEAHNVTLKKLTLDKDSIDNNRNTCWITRNSHNITIESCQFGTPHHYTDDENIHITDWPWNGLVSSVEDVTIDNCFFFRGEYGIRARSINVDLYAENLKISNNKFTEVRQEMSLLNCNDIEISKNQLFDNFSIAGEGALLYDHLGLDSALITGNYFFSTNTARVVRITSPFSAGDAPVIFNNNSVSHVERGNSFRGSIELIDVRNAFAINNSLYSKLAIGTPASNGPIILNDVRDSLVVYNNQLIYEGHGPIFDHESTYSADLLNSNYNNFYTEGNFSIGGGNTFDLHKTMTGQDSNSFFINPSFLSVDTLIPTNIDTLNNQGLFWGDVTKDILEATRDQFTPDIGAYEFGGENYDVLLDSISQPSNDNCGNPSNTLAVILMNNDQDSILQSVMIDWSINGVSGPQYLWTGILWPGQSEEVILASYPFIPNVNYEISAYISQPNGGTDNNSTNDSVNLYFFGDLNILGQDTICFGDSTILQSSFQDTNASYLWSNGASANETYVNLGGLYTLTVNAYGCPPFSDTFEVLMLPELISSFTLVNGSTLQSNQIGNFSYQWYWDGNELVGQTSSSYQMIYDGSYSLEITDEFGCSALSAPYLYNSSNVNINELSNPDYVIMPNPSDGIVKLILPNDYSGAFELLDVSGKCIMRVENVQSEQVIQLGNVSGGIYVVRLNELVTKRIMIVK